MNILPRFIRYRDAPGYLGVDRNRFDAEVRPYLIEIPIGDRGIAFDRYDLDSWADDYKNRNGRPSRKQLNTDSNPAQGMPEPVKQGKVMEKNTSGTGKVRGDSKLKQALNAIDAMRGSSKQESLLVVRRTDFSNRTTFLR
jgi:hypothetical protein